MLEARIWAGEDGELIQIIRWLELQAGPRGNVSVLQSGGGSFEPRPEHRLS
jgi:hypothetical protein